MPTTIQESLTQAESKAKRRRYNSMANPPTPGAFKLKPAAFYLSVSEPTLRRLVERGLIRPSRGLRHLIFSKIELDRYLSES
jgi:hypothetical protein